MLSKFDLLKINILFTIIIIIDCFVSNHAILSKSGEMLFLLRIMSRNMCMLYILLPPVLVSVSPSVFNFFFVSKLS